VHVEGAAVGRGELLGDLRQQRPQRLSVDGGRGETSDFGHGVDHAIARVAQLAGQAVNAGGHAVHGARQLPKFIAPVKRSPHRKIPLADALGGVGKLHNGQAQAPVGEGAKADGRTGGPHEAGDGVRRPLGILQRPDNNEEEEGESRDQCQERDLGTDIRARQRAEGDGSQAQQHVAQATENTDERCHG
jgi:hypothetical protein